ncbi:MAG TPA: type II secretion system F family protein, partial [Acidimicrobiales bacterium]|nr:type II secretion system F family protein [Acidimicrobiales bacterium]
RGGVARVTSDRRVLQLAIGAGVALLALLATGWPVGALLAGGIALSLPSVFGGKGARAAEIIRVEAIATWAGQLRDMLSGGNGLLETIEATAPFAPAPIRPEVARLAVGMRRGRLVPALRAFAADVDDPMADLVVASLVVATTEQVGRLGELLGMLAARTNEQAALRMRIDKDRASVRTQVKGVVLVTVVCLVGLTLSDRGLLDAYDSAEGQVVLAVIGSCFLAGFALLARLGRPQRLEGFVLAEEAP